MKSGISNITIFFFLLAGMAGLLLFAFQYNEAFPEASIDLKLSRQEVTARSRAFLIENGFDLSGYRAVTVFTEERNEINFLERHRGLKTANDLFRKTVAVWRWKVRWFKILEEMGYTVGYTPDGRLASFSRDLPESAPGLRIDGAQARHIAEKFLSQNLGMDLSRYSFVEQNSMEDHPHRLDQSLVWKLSDFGDVGGAQYRISVTLQGDKVGGFSQWLKIPEAWNISQYEIREKRNIIIKLSYLPIVTLYLLIAIFFLWHAHRGNIRWRWAFFFGGVYAMIVLLVQFNRLPFAYLSYDTTESLNIFWMKQLSKPFVTSILSFLPFVALLATSRATGNAYLSDRPCSSLVFAKSYLVSREASRQVLLGYGLAFAAVGYVTAFYVLGQKFLGVWSPVEVRFSNEFSTYFPPLTSIHTGISAAFSEELMFRLFAIALLFRVTKRFWPAIVIPAIVWGFAHTSYPQEPVWIRGVELSIAGIAYGWIFLRYGLITTLVSHFLYNLFVGVVPLLQSGQLGLIAGSLVSLALPLLLPSFLRLPHRLAFRRRRRDTSTPDDPPVVPFYATGLDPATPSASTPAITVKALIFYVLITATVYGISFLAPRWDFHGKAPSVKLKKNQGALLCQEALTGAGFDADGFSSFTEFRDKTYELPDYAISRFGIRGARERFQRYYGYSPVWATRWFKERTVGVFEAVVDEQGHLKSLNVGLAESDAGPKLDEGSAKKVAERFLARIAPTQKGDWEWIETNTMDYPNRLDYRFTYRDRSFNGGDLQRKMSLRISGDRVSSLGPPFYDVPEEWNRKREILKQTWRNSLREFAGGSMAAGIVIFIVVQVVILFRRRYAHRQDVKKAIRWTLVIGVLPAVLSIINDLPSFYHEYYYRTEASLSTYTAGELLGLVGQFIWMPPAMFFLFLLVRMICRAWTPEQGDFETIISSILPSRWGSYENRCGVVVGLAMAVFSSAFDRLETSAKALLLPDLFSPSVTPTDININQVSELLNLAGRIPQLVVYCLSVFVIVALLKRVCKKEGQILAVLTILTLLLTDTDSLSWRNLIVMWGVEMTSLLVMYYAVTRVIRWNIMAYVVWIWVTLNASALPNFKRFVLSASPEFFWPSVAQMAVLVLPIAFVFVYGYFKHNTGT